MTRIYLGNSLQAKFVIPAPRQARDKPGFARAGIQSRAIKSTALDSGLRRNDDDLATRPTQTVRTERKEQRDWSRSMGVSAHTSTLRQGSGQASFHYAQCERSVFNRTTKRRIQSHE
ncbi:MAG: hypothetical protein JWL63_1731 [Rhodocyclales bacterium]|nr:hypothetical protein [Rhodocyclales bacterium]